MKSRISILFTKCLATTLLIAACTKNRDTTRNVVQSLGLAKGEITLCGSASDKFGTVKFDLHSSADVQGDFNLATALLHSFEYTEAEKVYSKVISKDPTCTMAYWGAAMCNFHPLWSPPSEQDLEKGSKIIDAGRAVTTDKSSEESEYLEAIASIYDDWKELDHKTRLLKFEKATEKIYLKHPDDVEAAIFYSLALDASADPKDKSYKNQKKAGEILTTIFDKLPNHPGVAHYIIHNYDSPEMASIGLMAARKYALIASASAHAQHMPSHIFTRLGLWDESIQSNLKSAEAAQCYAQNSGIKGPWDEELHALDYLVYAYLQKGDDTNALKQLEYVGTIKEVFPEDFKDAYSLAAVPARYAVERKDWERASKLGLMPAEFPWGKFPWETANITFVRLLGFVHLKKLSEAKKELTVLQADYDSLVARKEATSLILF